MINEGAHLTQMFAELDAGTLQAIQAFGAAVVAIGLFELALKAAAVVQTMLGNPASAAAISGLGGGALGRMGLSGFGLGSVGAGYIGNEIYKNYNAMDGESHPATGPSAWAMI